MKNAPDDPIRLEPDELERTLHFAARGDGDAPEATVLMERSPGASASPEATLLLSHGGHPAATELVDATVMLGTPELGGGGVDPTVALSAHSLPPGVGAPVGADPTLALTMSPASLSRPISDSPRVGHAGVPTSPQGYVSMPAPAVARPHGGQPSLSPAPMAVSHSSRLGLWIAIVAGLAIAGIGIGLLIGGG